MSITKQTGQAWADETGMLIPSTRITASEKLREKRAFQLAKEASGLHQKLKDFKNTVQLVCAEVVDAIREENGIKPDSKGNITWHNFDRSIRVEVNVNEAIKFDDILIDGAKQKLMALIEANMTADDFVKGIVIDAFETTKGKLDTSRVLGLKKHNARVPSRLKAEWDEAMALIDKSISRPNSKSYQRIWLRNSEGKYINIDLNFSSL